MERIITKPVFWVLMLAMWSLVFPLITGAYNGIYLNTVAAGEVNSERFDRLMPKESYSDAEAAWQARTATVAHGGTAAGVVATSAYELGKTSSNGCEVDITGGSVGDEWYTPSGNLVLLSNATGGITECTWEKATPIFGVFNGFVRIILQVIALAAPLGFMMALGYFGSVITSSMDAHPILKVIMVVISVLIAAILVNIILPYIATVFYAIDRNRFIVFDQELGLIAGLLRNFFGIIFAAALVGSAWSIIYQIRDGATGGGGAGPQRQMAGSM